LLLLPHDDEDRGDEDEEEDGPDDNGDGDGYADEVAKITMDARVVSVLCATTGYSTLSLALDSGAGVLLQTTLPSRQPG
jgi:hypothetical protein